MDVDQQSVISRRKKELSKEKMHNWKGLEMSTVVQYVLASGFMSVRTVDKFRSAVLKQQLLPDEIAVSFVVAC